MTAACVLLLTALLQVTPELRQRVDAGLKAKGAGDLDGAVREFQRVVELAPEMAAAHVNLGAAWFEKKDYGKAIPALRKALELDATLVGARGMLGAALLAQGYAEEAIPFLEAARSFDLLGVALLESGRAREAVDRLEAALEKRPDDPDLLYYLGQAHGKLARQALERLRAAGPETARVQLVLGETAAAAGNREAAEKHLRAALARRPELRGAHYELGELHLAAGDYQKAEVEFRAESVLAPGSAASAWKLGLALLSLGRSKEALAELRRADRLAPGMPETELELGKALLANGDLAGAEPRFRAVVKAEGISPLAAAAHLQLAQIYRRLGRTADAERELEILRAIRAGRK